MQTTRLISSISYNTPEFLSGVLTRLVTNGILEYAHWIWHNPEEDETKQHAHIVVKPNRRLDTSALRNEFLEVCIGEDKPRCVLPFKNSVMRDWLLYAVHDPVYLVQKNQIRKIRYRKENILSSEPLLLDEQWREATEGGEGAKIKQFIALCEQGVPWLELLQSGIIPTSQMFVFKDIYHQVLDNRTFRNGRITHEKGGDTDD